MYDTRSFSKVPEKSGIYALYDGFLGNKCVYVGKSGNIKNRIRDHLILRISTVTAGFTATSINVENLTRVRWWTDEKFGDGDYLDAAETLAFQILNPVLASRGGRLKTNSEFLDDPEFVEEVENIINNPEGEMELLSHARLYQKIIELEERLSNLENQD